MKRCRSVLLVVMCTLTLSAKNWYKNTLHTINSCDGRGIRNYRKFMYKSAPYISIGVPAVIAACGAFKKDTK